MAGIGVRARFKGKAELTNSIYSGNYEEIERRLHNEPTKKPGWARGAMIADLGPYEALIIAEMKKNSRNLQCAPRAVVTRRTSKDRVQRLVATPATWPDLSARQLYLRQKNLDLIEEINMDVPFTYHEELQEAHTKSTAWLQEHEKNGLLADEMTYASLIVACAQVASSEPEQWMQKATEKGYKSKAVQREAGLIITSLIAARAKAGDIDKAEWWFQELAKKGKDNVARNIKAFTSILSACAKVGLIDKAEDWFQKLEDSGLKPDIVTYNSMIDACGKAGLIDKAEEWLRKLEDSGLKPNIVTYTSMIDACGKAGLIDKAEEWLRKLEDSGLKPNIVTYTSMIDACGKAGLIDKAEEWFQKLEDSNLKPNIVTYTSIIDAFAKEGLIDNDKAMEWFQALEDHGPKPNIVTLTTVIDACTKRGRLDQAEQWLLKMLEMGVKPNKVFDKVLRRATLDENEYVRWTELFQQ